MGSRDKKLSLLHRLSQETEALSMQEIMEKLGNSFSERSVRRWLTEMTKEGLVEKLGRKRSTKYRIIQRSSRNTDHSISCFSSKSKKILEQIKRPIHQRKPVAYDENWLDAYKPNTSFYIPLELRIQLHQAGKRSRNHAPAGTYAHQIYNRLLIDLSYNSSRLEGNTYSLLDTQKLLLEGASAAGKLDEEKIMILNHKEAIR